MDPCYSHALFRASKEQLAPRRSHFPTRFEIRVPTVAARSLERVQEQHPCPPIPSTSSQQPWRRTVPLLHRRAAGFTCNPTTDSAPSRPRNFGPRCAWASSVPTTSCAAAVRAHGSLPGPWPGSSIHRWHNDQSRLLVPSSYRTSFPMFDMEISPCLPPAPPGIRSCHARLTFLLRRLRLRATARGVPCRRSMSVPGLHGAGARGCRSSRRCSLLVAWG